MTGQSCRRRLWTDIRAEGMERCFSWSPEGMREKGYTCLVMERWGSCVLLDFMVVERSVLDLIIVQCWAGACFTVQCFVF